MKKWLSEQLQAWLSYRAWALQMKLQVRVDTLIALRTERAALKEDLDRAVADVHRLGARCIQLEVLADDADTLFSLGSVGWSEVANWKSRLVEIKRNDYDVARRNY